MIGWAVQHRIGVLTVGDPRGVLDVKAGRRHNLRQWQIGRAIAVLRDKAELAGVTVHRRRARHVLDVPGLPEEDRQTGGTRRVLPALRYDQSP